LATRNQIDVTATANLIDLYQTLLAGRATPSAEGAVPDVELRARRLDALVAANRQYRPRQQANGRGILAHDPVTVDPEHLPSDASGKLFTSTSAPPTRT
jgi:hypothetical protein